MNHYEGLAVPEYAERFKLSMAAELIDSALRENSEPGVLAIEAGLLTEASHSLELPKRRISQFVALDALERNVVEIRRRYQSFGVEAMLAGVERLLGDDLQPRRKFNLVYALSCFYTLEEGLAMRLTTGLWNMIATGGKLLIVNTTQGLRDSEGRGTIPRNCAGIMTLLNGLRASEIGSCDSFEDSTNSLAFLIATKA